MTVEAEAAKPGEDVDASTAPPIPPWSQASLADLGDIDFEAPIGASQSADSAELSELFRGAANGADGAALDVSATRIFGILAAVTGMHFKPQDPNEPFGPMFVFEGRRSAISADFQGPAVDLLATIAERAKHPVLRARLADVCWLLDRKRGRLGLMAAAAYVEIVEKAQSGSLKFRFDKDRGVLKFEARDLLRRALVIGRATGMEKEGPAAARKVATDLRVRSLDERLPIPMLWFGHLDLDFRLSDPADVGKGVEVLIVNQPPGTDPHTIVDLWRLATRAYHFAKCDEDKYRCQSAAAEELASMAERQPMAMLASSFLADAMAELHGIPNMKDRRKELHHRLIDVQARIPDEMSSFSIPTELTELIRQTERQMAHSSLRDKLFAFAVLSRSPDPKQLIDEAVKSIREHPLSSLFATSHHDREGKVVHRSAGAGFGDQEDDSAIQNQIAQSESIRRHLVASSVEVGRQAIARAHYLSDEVFARLLVYSAFVPRDTVMTYSRGFTRFFQGDFVSALYILTPLLENSLRHALKSHGHDVTKFDDARRIQADRTISSLYEQMRPELDSVFGDAITTDIDNVFLKKPGPYLRHSVSHGLLHDGDPYSDNSMYACWLIFHLCMLPLFRYRTQLTLPYDDIVEDDEALATATAPD
jgi:hypothetical protein